MVASLPAHWDHWNHWSQSGAPGSSWESHGGCWSRSRAPGSYRGYLVNRGARACSGDARGSAKGKDPVGVAICTVISEHVTVCMSL